MWEEENKEKIVREEETRKSGMLRKERLGWQQRKEKEEGKEIKAAREEKKNGKLECYEEKDAASCMENEREMEENERNQERSVIREENKEA